MAHSILFPASVSQDISGPCTFLDLALLLHFLVEASDASRLVTGVDILPGDGVLAAAQNVLVDAGQPGAEDHGAPLAVADNLELHAAADGLAHAKGALERLHADGLLRGLPVLEAGLEGVGRRGARRLRVVGGRADAVAQRVVEAGRRGRRGRGLLRGAAGVGVAAGSLAAGDEAHRLAKS